MRYHVRAMIWDIRDSIRSQRGRIGLSSLAVAIGVSSLTILLSLLRGLEEKSRRMVAELGADVVAVIQQPVDDQDRAPRLSPAHLELLRDSLPDCILAGVSRFSVSGTGKQKNLTAVLTDQNFQRVRRWRMSAGRFLDRNDLTFRQRHAVVTSTLSVLYNWNLGDTIVVGRMPFMVVGIIQAAGGAEDADTSDPSVMLGERVVLVPSTIQHNWAGKPDRPIANLDALFIRPRQARGYAAALSRARRLLSQPGSKVENVSWITPESLIQNIVKLQRTLNLTLGSTAALCLILGGVTLMSLMVANVRQRVQEIGLRRALGATSRAIAMMFVIEAVAITLVAGLAGAVLSHALLLSVRGHVAIPVRLDALTALVPPGAALVLGMFFSWWPARSAVRISPSDALRNE